MKDFIKDNWFKIGLLVMVFIAGTSIFYYHVIFLPQRPRIEKQKQYYISKRREDCYDIYIKEKTSWSNVEDYSYDEYKDVCVIKYTTDEYKDVDCTRKYRWQPDLMLNCLAGTFKKEYSFKREIF